MLYCKDCKKEIPFAKRKQYCRSCGKKGDRNPNWEGKTMTEKTRKLISLSLSKRKGDKSPGWKGDKVGKSGLHCWIKKRKPRPQFCENCKTGFPIDLANISQEYKRDINDFRWLCRRCHMTEDGRIKNLEKGRILKGKEHPCFGKRRSKETRKKISNSRKGKYAGANHPNWKGGKPKCVSCGKEITRGYRYCIKCQRSTRPHLKIKVK